MLLEHLYQEAAYKQFSELSTILFKNKPKKKNLLKAVEEFNELSLAIIQTFTKKGPEDKVKEELVDAFMNLNILAKYFSLEELVHILEEKTKKMKLTQKKYLNGATTSANT